MMTVSTHPSASFHLTALAQGFFAKTPGGEPFLTQEAKGARSLREFLQDPTRQAGFGLKERLSLFLEVCYLAAHTHTQGVLHRDLTPAHIFLGEDRTTYLGGFGKARPLGERGEPPPAGERVGTPGY